MTTLLEYLKKEAKIVEDYAADVAAQWSYYQVLYAQQGWTHAVANLYWTTTSKNTTLDNMRKELKSKLDSLYPILKEASQSLSTPPPQAKTYPAKKCLKA